MDGTMMTTTHLRRLLVASFLLLAILALGACGRERAEPTATPTKTPIGQEAAAQPAATPQPPASADEPAAPPAQEQGSDPTPADTQKTVAVIAATVLNVRSQPDPNAQLVQTVDQGQQFDVIGRTEAGDWIQIGESGRELGWVAAEFVTLQTVDIAAQPAAPAAGEAAPAARPASAAAGGGLRYTGQRAGGLREHRAQAHAHAGQALAHAAGHVAHRRRSAPALAAAGEAAGHAAAPDDRAAARRARAAAPFTALIIGPRVAVGNPPGRRRGLDLLELADEALLQAERHGIRQVLAEDVRGLFDLRVLLEVLQVTFERRPARVFVGPALGAHRHVAGEDDEADGCHAQAERDADGER